MTSRQKTEKEMRDDGTWADVSKEIEAFKTAHDFDEHKDVGILSLDARTRDFSYYQVLAAMKLVHQDRTYALDTETHKRDDHKPYEKRKASLLVVHEVGTGKTMTGILAMAGVHRLAQLAAKQDGESVHSDKTMIIVPKSVLLFWYEKVQEWTTLRGLQVLMVAKLEDVEGSEDSENFKKLMTAQVIITAPDVLLGALKFGKEKTVNRKVRPAPLQGFLKDKSESDPHWKHAYPRIHNLFKLLEHTGRTGKRPSRIGLTIVDEVHLNSPPWTWKGEAIRKFTRESVFKMGLTGTPVSHHPSELAHLADLLDVRMHDMKRKVRVRPRLGVRATRPPTLAQTLTRGSGNRCTRRASLRRRPA